MAGEPVVTLADLADHVVESRCQLVEFVNAATEGLHVVTPDRHLGHVAGQRLQRFNQPGHQPSLQVQAEQHRQRDAGTDQPDK